MVTAPPPEAPARRRPFSYRRSLLVAAPTAEVWDTMVRVDEHAAWWPWLRYREPPGPLLRGTAIRAVISPPLPYALHLVCWVDTVEPGRSIQVTVGGDLIGPARVDIEEHADGSSLTLAWELRPDRILFQVLATVARPLLAWGHDWVITTGATQFERATGLPVSLQPEERPTGGRRWTTGVSVLTAGAVAAGTAALWRGRGRRNAG